MRSLTALVLAAGVAYAQPAMDRYLASLAESHLEKRAAAVSSLTRPQAEQRRVEIRRKILAELGGLPPTRGALNARVTGSFNRQGYRAENLLYESQPRLYVTANVYVPTNGTPPFPAVIGVAGHSINGKASSTY